MENEIPDITTEDRIKAIDWMFAGNTGSSSESMCRAIFGSSIESIHGYSYPRDASDFRRCLGFLDAVPVARHYLSEVAKLGSVWSIMISRWDELEELFKLGSYMTLEIILDELMEI